MAIADLTVALSVQSSGTAEVDKFVSALNKCYDEVADLRKQKPPDKNEWEWFGEGVRNAFQNPVRAAGDASNGLLDKIGRAGGALVITSTSALDVDGVGNLATSCRRGRSCSSIQAWARRRIRRVGGDSWMVRKPVFGHLSHSLITSIT